MNRQSVGPVEGAMLAIISVAVVFLTLMTVAILGAIGVMVAIVGLVGRSLTRLFNPLPSHARAESIRVRSTRPDRAGPVRSSQTQPSRTIEGTVIRRDITD